jgi:PKD repeat protein
MGYYTEARVDPITGPYTSTFWDSVEFEYPAIEFGSVCLSSLGSVGAFNDTVEIGYPAIEMAGVCISDLGDVGVKNAGFDLLYPAIEMGENYVSTFNPGVFDTECTELWFYAEDPDSPTITTEARVDPITGPYTSTFYPGIFIVVGKLLDFMGSPRYGRAALTVQFTDLSSPVVIQWYWEFGDGHTSIAKDPEHVYEFPGIYDVRLYVKIAARWYLVYKRRYITVWPGGLRVAQTDTCWRLAVKPEQGIGWTQYTGNFVFPESHVGTIKITDTNNQVSWLIFDSSTGRPYILANRNGPPGTEITKEFRDKVSDYSGLEIPTRITLKEHTGKDEKPMRHEVSKMFMRPYTESNKNATGYGANGQRDAQEVDIRVYLDGAETDAAKAVDVPINGEISLDKKLQAARVQVEYRTAASEFKVVGFSQKYLYLNKKAPPSGIITNEQTQQNEFGLPVLWLSRGPNLLMDRATGVACTGTTLGTTTGPDGKTQSAMAFAATTGITKTLSGNLTGDFSIAFCLSSILASTGVLTFSVGAGQVNANMVGGVYFLEYVDASGSYSQQLDWDGDGWVFLTIARSGYALRFTENGVHLQQFVLPSIEAIGGDVGIMTLAAGYLFDLRILAAALSTEAALYYYTDLTQNSGNSFLPMW